MTISHQLPAAMSTRLASGMRDVKVADARKVPKGEMKKVIVPGSDQELLLVQDQDGRILAIDNKCPHKKASLHKGDIEDLGEHLGGLCVRCPKHRKKYGGGLLVKFNDGRCRTKRPLNDEGKEKKIKRWLVGTYETRVDSSGAVYVQLPISDSSDSDSSSESSVVVTKEDTAQKDPSKWFDCVLEDVSPRQDSAGDVFVIRFSFKSEALKARFLSLAEASGCTHTAWHVWLQLGDVEREYTPISDFAEVAASGQVLLLVRLYSDGQMSSKLRGARPGTQAFLSVSRPTLDASMWTPTAMMTNHELWRRIAEGTLRLGMVCAGTGVTPCVQVLAFVVEALRRKPNSSNGARAFVCGLLTSNRQTSGTLMFEELRLLESQAPANAVVVRHTLTIEESPACAAKRSRSSRDDVHTFSGRISQDMLDVALPAPSLGNSSGPCLVMVTGPPGFAEHCVPLLVALGHAREMIVELDA